MRKLRHSPGDQETRVDVARFRNNLQAIEETVDPGDFERLCFVLGLPTVLDDDTEERAALDYVRAVFSYRQLCRLEELDFHCSQGESRLYTGRRYGLKRGGTTKGLHEWAESLPEDVALLETGIEVYTPTFEKWSLYNEERTDGSEAFYCLDPSAVVIRYGHEYSPIKLFGVEGVGAFCESWAGFQKSLGGSSAHDLAPPPPQNFVLARESDLANVRMVFNPDLSDSGLPIKASSARECHLLADKLVRDRKSVV